MAHSGHRKNSQLYTEAGLGSENCNYRFDLNTQCQRSKSDTREETVKLVNTEGAMKLMLEDHESILGQELNHIFSINCFSSLKKKI